MNLIGRFVYLSLSILLMSCSQTEQAASDVADNNAVSEHSVPAEQIDDEAAQRLHDSLMSSMNNVLDGQRDSANLASVNDLEQAVEQDQQVLIDLALEQSEQENFEQAQDIAESLERNKEAEHSSLEETD